MALISCGECGNKVSTQAAACPQCGAPPVPPLPLVQPPAKSEFITGCIAFVVIISVLAAGVWVVREMSTPDAYPPKKDAKPAGTWNGPAVVLPQISAEASVSITHLQVFNSSARDWPEYTIWLNGSSGYRYKGSGLAAGLGKEIDLLSFVDRSGNRFQPMEKSVRDVMISVPGMTEWSRSK